jgi:hypothetical protein
MGMNHTRVIRSLTGCWISDPADRGSAGQLVGPSYRHRIVSNKPLIMNANATA